MIADIVQTGLTVMVGARARLRRGPRLVRVSVRVPARARVRLVRLRRTGRRRRDQAAAPADPAVHRGVHDRVHAPRRVRPAVRADLQGRRGAVGGRRRRDRDRGVHDRVRAAARLDRALRGAPAVPVEGPPGRDRRVAARHGVRRGLDAVPGTGADRDPRHRRHARARFEASCCSWRTPWGWGFRSCSWGSASNGSWARSAGSAATTHGSPASPGRSWSWSGCCW